MKMVRRILAASATCLLSWSASANLITVERSYDLYGLLSNEGEACACTSIVNSFKYLISTHPGQADGLIPDLNNNGVRELFELSSVRGELRGGWTSPGSLARTGMGAPADRKDIWEQTIYWMQDFAPGVHFTFAGMTDPSDNPSAWYLGQYVTSAYASWDFLWQQMTLGADVELGIYGAFGGHALTLTSLKFDDRNNNSIWETGETRWLDYLDPNNTGQLFERTLWVNTDGSLGFNWYNGGANTPADVYIGRAFSENIPTPSSVSLMLAALIALGGATLMKRESKNTMLILARAEEEP